MLFLLFLAIGVIILLTQILPSLGYNPKEDLAKRLWLIYFGYTAAETLFLSLAGMSFFDALNHSMSTLSTGGFSTKNASVAHWNDTPLIQYIIVLFMFLAGTNFVLSYFVFKGNIRRVVKDEEFKLYFKFILIFSLIVGGIIYFNTYLNGVSTFSHPLTFGVGEGSFRHAFFQVVAIVTTML